MKISFIGLGIMGSRMAANLLNNGIDLAVYNRSKDAVDLLVEKGARSGSSYRDVVKGADIVFTMLSTPEVVEYVALDDQHGFLSNIKEGALWVDCSTVNPSFTYRACRLAHNAGVRFIDAPVAGSLPHAEKAELSFFVGATTEDFQLVHPILSHMGAYILHIGPIGRGSAYKMLINTMLAQSIIAFSETVLLGEKMGLDRNFLLDNLPKAPVCAPLVKLKTEMFKQDEYPVMFPLEWMQKDLHLAAISAYEVGQPMYLLNIAKEIFMDAKAAGMGRLDFAAVFRYLNNR